MKVGLFGGSFDPIHRGHIEPVRHAKNALGLDRVIYLPTARPPHKSERFAPPHARYSMVEMALLGDNDLHASAFELRDETCYTVDTIRHFRRELPDAELVLLIGADSWASFTSWYEWRQILDGARLAVLVRPGWRTGDLGPPFDRAQAEGRLHFVANKPWPISSSEIRARLEQGEALTPGSVSQLVLDYIVKYGLYGPAEGSSSV